MKWAEHSVTVLEWMRAEQIGFALLPVFAFQFGKISG